MHIYEYQVQARKTAEYFGQGSIIGILYNALQIASEAGEIAGKLSKHIYKNGLDDLPRTATEDLEKELGDLLWHVAQIATELNTTLHHIAQINLTKLADRKERNVLHGNGDNR